DAKQENKQPEQGHRVSLMMKASSLSKGTRRQLCGSVGYAFGSIDPVFDERRPRWFSLRRSAAGYSQRVRIRLFLPAAGPAPGWPDHQRPGPRAHVARVARP